MRNMIYERKVSWEEEKKDRARLANAAGKRAWAYVLGNLTPDSKDIQRYAYKMYERNPISGCWSFAYWVQPDEVDEDKDLLMD